MTGITPTPEQQAALDLFATGQSLAIEAGAGTGKTSTLNLLARSTTRRGQYVAFNKAIVEDGKGKFPATVACNTAHSLAFRAVGKDYRARLDNSRRMKSHDLARVLGVNPIRVTTYMGDSKELSAGFLAGLTMSAIERFCQSADAAPTHRHVPMIEGLDAPPVAERPRSYAVNNEVARALEPTLARAWKDLQRYEGALPFRHSHYLKMWERSTPRLYADYILFDECQDASPVMLSVVDAQEHAQKVFVGDAQQAIYEFTGAVNALARIRETGECERTFLTQSFRFGPAVANQANVLLASLGADLRLRGLDSLPSTVGPVDNPAAILCRTNATAVRQVLAAQTAGRRPHLVGGGTEVVSFARAAERLQGGQRVEHPDLACFETWGEVQDYVDQDEQGGELRLLVTLVTEFGVATILEALDRMPSEHNADLIVSTAHKAKGREWDSVLLADDFPKEAPGPDELRLLYVACTRARLALDVTAVGYLHAPTASPAGVI